MKKKSVIIFLVLAICLVFSGGIQTVSAKVKTLEADMVIIGGGGAGTTAALTAIQNGVKKVILLEKEADLGLYMGCRNPYSEVCRC
jgi:heterodisulfide reductase subunit A-like polyferredoxin